MLDIWTQLFLALIILFSIVIIIIVSLIMGGVITETTITNSNGVQTTTVFDPTAWYWIMILVFSILIFILSIISIAEPFSMSYKNNEETKNNKINTSNVNEKINREIPKGAIMEQVQ